MHTDCFSLDFPEQRKGILTVWMSWHQAALPSLGVQKYCVRNVKIMRYVEKKEDKKSWKSLSSEFCTSRNYIL